jgi:hypothetical protein
VSAYGGDAAAIGKLNWNWGKAYVISYANGLYHAECRDNGAQVHAPDQGVGHVAGAGLTDLMASGSPSGSRRSKRGPGPRSETPSDLPSAGRDGRI